MVRFGFAYLLQHGIGRRLLRLFVYGLLQWKWKMPCLNGHLLLRQFLQDAMCMIAANLVNMSDGKQDKSVPMGP